ncbi:MAG: alkaline phosphatase family protein [Candidatus Rokuibacteriota bacterium]
MRRAVLVVCDSLRRDLITPATAPALAALAETSADFINSRGVFPSVTRVTSACIATGCRPASHGLLGNTMVLDEGDGLVCLSVAKPEFRERMRRATGGTLRRATLAEHLARTGGSIVMSNVSPGAAYFQDPDGHGWVYHRAGSFAPGLVPVPAGDQLVLEQGNAGDATMTDRFCEDVLIRRRPPLAVLWLSEPDFTGHRTALGSPAHRAAIAGADRCVERVRETLDVVGDGDDALLIVCSDHGMETTGRTIRLDQLLVDAGLKASVMSRDVVVAPNGTAALISRSRAARATVEDLRRFLEAQDWVARVLTGAELAEQGLPTDEALAVAVTMRADDRPNEFGVRGFSDIVLDPEATLDYTGCGQHGGLGSNEQRPFLFVRGGGFAPGSRVNEGVSPIDIAPTVLRHLALPWTGVDGRPLPPRGP